MSDWLEIRAELREAPEDWSLFAEVFQRHGCPSSLQVDRPPSISACLSNTDSASSVADAIEADFRALGAVAVHRRVTPNEDWSSLWKLHFKPVRVGRRLVIRPTWEEFASAPDDLVIVLDPGQAFGTGDHATTRLCLRRLEDRVTSATAVLDLGAGSGILAIAAKLLGAPQVDASDIDPISVEVARENVALNQVDVHCFCAEGFDDPRLAEEWDVVVSNIISATLIRLAPDAFRRVRPGGVWIVSGIIEANWPDVRAAAEATGFAFVESEIEGDWVGATFQRPV